MNNKIEEIDFDINEIDLKEMINKSRTKIFEYLSSKSLIDIMDEFDNFDEKKYSLTDEEFKKEILNFTKVIFRNYDNHKTKFIFKHDTDFETNEILRKGQEEKRKGNYERSMAIYNFILKNAGPSGTLFIAMAKTRASQGYYEEAMNLFLLASNSMGCDVETCAYHMLMLMSKEEMSKKEFKEYLKSISGNPNFIMPKENKSRILEVEDMKRIERFLSND